MTDLKLDIIACIARGRSNREIAEELMLAEQTIKNHLTKIFRELGLRDRAALLLWAHRRKAA